jgi:hypothetical protein
MEILGVSIMVGLLAIGLYMLRKSNRKPKGKVGPNTAEPRPPVPGEE